jgi:hypothetical protein
LLPFGQLQIIATGNIADSGLSLKISFSVISLSQSEVMLVLLVTSRLSQMEYDMLSETPEVERSVCTQKHKHLIPQLYLL